MAMHVTTRNFSHIRSFITPVRMVSTEAKNNSETKQPNSLQKVKGTAKEPIFYQRNAELNADIKGNQFSFKYQISAQMTYDFWQFVVDFIDTISHRNKLQEAKGEVAELMDELHTAKHVKKRIEDELELLRQSLIQNNFRKQKEITQDSVLVASTVEKDLQKAESRLTVSLKVNSATEQLIFDDLMEAVKNSYKQEELHSRFLRASIFIGVAATILLTIIASYIYHFSLHHEINKRGDRIRELDERLRIPSPKEFDERLRIPSPKELDERLRIPSPKEFDERLRIPSPNTESWGSYIKGYARPFYSWAIPKK